MRVAAPSSSPSAEAEYWRIRAMAQQVRAVLWGGAPAARGACWEALLQVPVTKPPFHHILPQNRWQMSVQPSSEIHVSGEEEQGIILLLSISLSLFLLYLFYSNCQFLKGDLLKRSVTSIQGGQRATARKHPPVRIKAAKFKIKDKGLFESEEGDRQLFWTSWENRKGNTPWLWVPFPFVGSWGLMGSLALWSSPWTPSGHMTCPCTL